MNISDRTTAAQIISAIHSTGTKAPAAVLDAYQDCQRVSTEARQLHPKRDSLAPAVAAALIEGRDPVTDPQVQRMDWASAGVRPTLTGVREMAAACGALFDAVTGGQVRHPGQVELTRGVLGAKQRPMVGGQGFGWERKPAGSSTLIAGSLAVWGVDSTTVLRPRRRKPGEGDARTATVL